MYIHIHIYAYTYIVRHIHYVDYLVFIGEDRQTERERCVNKEQSQRQKRQRGKGLVSHANAIAKCQGQMHMSTFVDHIMACVDLLSFNITIK